MVAFRRALLERLLDRREVVSPGQLRRFLEKWCRDPTALWGPLQLPCPDWDVCLLYHADNCEGGGDYIYRHRVLTKGNVLVVRGALTLPDGSSSQLTASVLGGHFATMNLAVVMPRQGTHKPLYISMVRSATENLRTRIAGEEWFERLSRALEPRAVPRFLLKAATRDEIARYYLTRIIPRSVLACAKED